MNGYNRPFTQRGAEPPRHMHEQALQIGLRILLTLVLLLLASLARHTRLAGAASYRQSVHDRLVLALYYPWFDENTWTSGTTPDLPAQPYASRDRTVMARHIQQAQQAGIDAFMVAWYGPKDGNPTETNLAALLDEAAARNFKIGILFETTSPFFAGPGDAAAALQHALTVHAGHPAFLRADGKPVILFWRPQLWSVDTWQSIRDQVDPSRSSLWIAEGVDTSYLRVFDGHYLYSNTWNPPTDLTYTNTKFARLVAQAEAALGAPKLWLATVMPGYDDTRTGRPNAFVQSREGGAYYERSWQAALASQPDWIVITSFNEWPEGTYIEPSQREGDRYLRLTATWSARFKQGTGVVQAASASPAQPVQPPPVDAPAPEPVDAPQPAPTEPTAYVDVLLLNLRAGPSTRHAIVGQLPQGAALTITGQDPRWPDWRQVRYNGQTGWVYAPLTTQAGPLARVPEVEAPALPPVLPVRLAQELPTWLLQTAGLLESPER